MAGIKPLLSIEGSLVLSLATVGAVYGVYQLDVGPVSQVHMTDPNHPALETSRKKAGYTSLVMVAGLAVLARDPNVVILGGAAIIAMELHYRHAIMVDSATGQIVPPGPAAYAPAGQVSAAASS